MPKPPKAPLSRGFTVAEKRSIVFERIALGVALGVALVAATISFIALTWVGTHMRMPDWVAPLVPLAIDGFGIACSVGIVRSTSEGKPWRDRASEWLGLCTALGLSVAGNVAHVLDVSPAWLLVTFAVAVPTIVAYSVHVYGRAMVQGISARIMADEPDKLQMDVPGIAAAPARTLTPLAAPVQPSTRREARTLERTPARIDLTTDVRAQAEERAQAITQEDTPRVSVHTPARATGAPTPRTPAGVVAAQTARTPAEPRKLTPEESLEWDRKIKAEVYRRAALGPNARDEHGPLNDKDGKPVARRLHIDLQVPRSDADTRRKVGDSWKEHQEQQALESPLRIVQ